MAFVVFDGLVAVVYIGGALGVKGRSLLDFLLRRVTYVSWNFRRRCANS